MAHYTANLYGSNATMFYFQQWATGIGTAFTTLGLTKQSDTYTAQWASAAAIGSAALPTVAGALNSSVFPGNTAGVRTGLLSTAFKGVWSSATAYTAGQVVTYTINSLPMVFIAVGSSTNQAPMSYSAPTYTLNSTYWSPYYMEIYEFGASASTPLYIKIEYGCSTTSGAAGPMTAMSVSTGYGGGGYLTGNGSTVTMAPVSTGAGTVQGFTCYFTSDNVNYFGMAMWDGTTTNVGNATYLFERDIEGTTASAPVYGNNFVWTAWSYGSYWQSQVIPYSGSLPGAQGSGSSSCLPGVTLITSSHLFNGASPLFPVYPQFGASGNPLTILTSCSASDYADGGTASTTIYGATHTYLIIKSCGFVLASVGEGIAGGSLQSCAYGLRWD